MGNTVAEGIGIVQDAVHPHLRGEYLRSLQQPRQRYWFTPTCVGNTHRFEPGRRLSSVHPHLRGEYSSFSQLGESCPGSPPPAWGIRWRGVRSRIPHRFTPTCVGNTAGRRTARKVGSVHPHLRGEYDRRVGHCRAGHGSPPPAWGIQDAMTLGAVYVRFTPTCVGNTSTGDPPVYLLSVHPHLRGEYVLPLLLNRPSAGSPPPAWGILRAPLAPALASRFTPTCVGNTE